MASFLSSDLHAPVSSPSAGCGGGRATARTLRPPPSDSHAACWSHRTCGIAYGVILGMPEPIQRSETSAPLGRQKSKALQICHIYAPCETHKSNASGISHGCYEFPVVCSFRSPLMLTFCPHRKTAILKIVQRRESGGMRERRLCVRKLMGRCARTRTR